MPGKRQTEDKSGKAQPPAKSPLAVQHQPINLGIQQSRLMVHAEMIRQNHSDHGRPTTPGTLCSTAGPLDPAEEIRRRSDGLAPALVTDAPARLG